ncbi:Phototropic-responsive NPH3 family protein [Klebsormidium nitens]|uniref:Phototropic-responsive NPH3 family protein n=1 Tax=Klebsormidium nitens TaxID=105231 RepID=A0A1Y1HP23_KLENI|nr:Phototropic-responsive NPH3 family protein [Klebsormidium nitens]|eukprot:GAQ80380.1 Phototropic-responsive NPH3 family protein [Klebsormidium nitens]
MGSALKSNGEQTGGRLLESGARGADMPVKLSPPNEIPAQEEKPGSPERVSFKKKVEEWERRLGARKGLVASGAGFAVTNERLTEEVVSNGRGEAARKDFDTGLDDKETTAQRTTGVSDTRGLYPTNDVSASEEEEGFSGVAPSALDTAESPVEKDVTLAEVLGTENALPEASRNRSEEVSGWVEERQQIREDGGDPVPLNGTWKDKSGRAEEAKKAADSSISTLRGGALWKPNPAMHSDLTVQVESASFQLHKSAMCARSGLLARLTSGRPHVERTRVTLADLPGGEKTFELVVRFCYGERLHMSSGNIAGLRHFELVVRFCYGERLHMSPGNIAGLRYAAAYLEMTEEFSPPGHLNLLTLTEAFLDAVALRTMADALRVLLGCQALGEPAEACDLPGRAMEAIAAHVARFGVEHHSRALRRQDAPATEPEAAPPTTLDAPASDELPSADLRPPIQTPPVNTLREKWVRQLAKLEAGTFARLLTKLENWAVDYRLVGALIVLYGQKALPELFWPESHFTSEERATTLQRYQPIVSPYDLSADSDVPGTFETPLLQGEEGDFGRDRTAQEYAQARGLEVLVACLPEPLDAIGPRPACALLAAARRLSAPFALQDELEERISAQLALVSAEDLILVSRPGEIGSETDVEWVLRMVAAFLEGAAWRARVARAGAFAGVDTGESQPPEEKRGEKDSQEAVETQMVIDADVIQTLDHVSRRVSEGDATAKAASDVGEDVPAVASGATESAPDEKPSAPGGKKNAAKRPPWVWASLQTRRRPNVASLSPEKCESPPIADVTKRRGRAWRFRGRKAGGFDVENSTAGSKEAKSSEIETSGAAVEQQLDWGLLKGASPHILLAESSLSGGISQPSTEPRSEKSAPESSSVEEGSTEFAEAQSGDHLSASAAPKVAGKVWYKEPAETYRGLQRYPRLTDEDESEELYVQAISGESDTATGTQPEGKAGFTAFSEDHPETEWVDNGGENNVAVPRLAPFILPESSPPRYSIPLTSIQLPRAGPGAAAREILEGLEAAAAPSRSELMALSAILDEYLRTVAEDPELDVDAFCALATCLPGDARPEDDGLYVALVTFLTAHPTLSQRDEFLLCRCVDWAKLSEAAREDAAAIDVIPDHARMKVLVIEKRNLKEKLLRALATGSAEGNPSEPRLKIWEQSDEGLAAATEAAGGPGLRVVKECAELKREHQRLAIEGALVKMRLAELERDHFELIQERSQRLGGFLGCFGCTRRSADVSKLDEE